MADTDVEQTEAALRDGSAAVIDIREASEFAQGHVPGVIHIPMAQLSTRAAELDRNQPVYLICASGNRSSRMAELLTSAGFDASSVAGGTQAWEQSGRPIERSSSL